MPDNKLTIAGAVFTCAVLAFLVWIGFQRYIKSGGEFLDVKLVEVIAIAASIGSAVFVATYIATHITNDTRKRDIILQALETMETRINEIAQIATEYRQAATEERERAIKQKFKIVGAQAAAIDMSIREQCAQRDISTSDKFVVKFQAFKRATTDTPFGSKNLNYTGREIWAAEKAHSDLLGEIFANKLRLYS